MTDITTTDAIRRALVAESEAYHERRKPYFQALRADRPEVTANRDIYEVHATAGAYAWLLAALLRKLAEDHGPEYAAECAAMVQEVMDDGIDWLEDANSDLDGDTAGSAR